MSVAGGEPELENGEHNTERLNAYGLPNNSESVPAVAPRATGEVSQELGMGEASLGAEMVRC